MFEAIGQVLDRTANFTLQVLIDADVLTYKDQIQQISTEATQVGGLGGSQGAYKEELLPLLLCC